MTLTLIKDSWSFLKTQRKLWLFPFFVGIMVLAIVLYFAQSAVLAPFIYTLF